MDWPGVTTGPRVQLPEAALDLPRTQQGLRSTGLGAGQDDLWVCGGAVLTPSQPERSSCALYPWTLRPISFPQATPSSKAGLAGRRGLTATLGALPPRATDLSSEPLFAHLQNGDANRTHPQGIPGGITQDLPTCRQPARHTSWGSSVWVCPFQLLKQTALLICQRCSINVYYIKNTSVGLRHSGLKPEWLLSPEHMAAAGAELPIRSWPAWPCWRTPMHPSRPCSNVSVSGTGSCCPSVAAQHSSMDDASCRELPGHPAQGQAQGTQGPFADVHTWTKREAEWLGHPYILFLILPFLE